MCDLQAAMIESKAASPRWAQMSLQPVGLSDPLEPLPRGLNRAGRRLDS